MQSVLEDLFFGNYVPFEHITPKGSEFTALNRKISVERGFLRNKLSDTDFSRFESLESLYTDSSSMHSAEAFSVGFRLAVMLIAEAYTVNKDLLEISELTVKKATQRTDNQ